MKSNYKNTCTIIGAGFGLYGYLPAVVKQSNMEVILPAIYQEKILSRPELSSLLKNIKWVDHIKDALSQVDTLVLAIPPKSQELYLNNLSIYSNIQTLLIEKPIASTPDLSILNLANLESLEKNYVVGYSFLHTTWHKSIKWPVDLSLSVNLTWSFMAHHFKFELHNWKRLHSQGGGALRFYGIHLIAMLASRGYSDVEKSVLFSTENDEPEMWNATFIGQSLPRCVVTVNTKSKSQFFKISASNSDELILNLETPFSEENTNDGNDQRVSLLYRQVELVRSNPSSLYFVYKNTNELWSKVEKITIFNKP